MTNIKLLKSIHFFFLLIETVYMQSVRIWKYIIDVPYTAKELTS